MKLSYQRAAIQQATADVIAVFISQDKDQFKKDIAPLRKLFGKRIDTAVSLEKFEAKKDQLLALYADSKFRAPRIYLVGIGGRNERNLERYRRAAAAAAKKAKASHAVHLALQLPDAAEFVKDDLVRAICDGAWLSVYKYNKYKSEKKDENLKLTEITIIESPAGKDEKLIKKAISESKIVCEAVCFARDLENAPGNDLYPESLAAAARESAQKHGYRAEIWDKRRIGQAGFGGLIGVNSGSARPPRFIILEHNSGAKNLLTIVLVGKGITFDSGGISIKPAAGMSEMKIDMGGAAAVIGTLEAATRLKLPVHLIGLIPTTENMPSGSAMRPGDIIKHYNGKTSEVDNTDAEGRLVLADALGYAATYKPDAVIDLATLTGACVVALGFHAAGMFGNDDELMNRLKEAGEKTYERVWQLPLYEEYEKQIKSDVADVKNTGGRWGGAITAALFLKKFIGEYHWAHLDIAGPAILEEDFPYAPRGGSGFGVRLLVEFLKRGYEGKSAKE
jgi:leucyl aminopeptidase